MDPALSVVLRRRLGQLRFGTGLTKYAERGYTTAGPNEPWRPLTHSIFVVYLSALRSLLAEAGKTRCR